MSQSHWLVKQEPGAYAWSDFVRDGRAAWTGIRNFQARNHLRSMRRGDLVLYYHTGGEKQVVGMAKVVREAYPDPTADEGNWVCVDLEPDRAVDPSVTLEQIRNEPALQDLALIRQSRLSVMPVTAEQWSRILRLRTAEAPEPGPRRSGLR